MEPISFGILIALIRAGGKTQRLLQDSLFHSMNHLWGHTVAMFRLDYLSCFLTIIATILVGRKMWTGLVVSGVNSMIVCVIGVHTSQCGFIPANMFCICIYALNIRSWLKVQKDSPQSVADIDGEQAADTTRTNPCQKQRPRGLRHPFKLHTGKKLRNMGWWLARADAKWATSSK